MISFGFVTINDRQEIDYSTEIAKRAERYGITVFRFTPLDIDPLTEKARGWQFHAATQSWTESVFAIPAFLYDRCFYRADERSKKSKPIMQWLKQRPDITFLGYGFPSKWELYKKLIDHPLLSHYVPKTTLLRSPTDLLHMIRKEKSVICKPEHGSRGQGIYVVKQVEGHLHILDTNGQTIATIKRKTDLQQWVETLLRRSSYLIQPFLPLKTKQNEPFDVRFFFQKNEYGQWSERGRGIRVGAPGTIIANVSAGASISGFSEWFKQIPAPQRLFITDGIETITTVLPSYLEEKFGPLFELGLDLGITEEGAVWLIDVNSKPGRKIITALAPEKRDTIYEAPLRYCLFLANGVNVR
ncbi:endospore coat-associated protein YheC [Parageobacillus thermoglucosidasius]|uniref:YheC/YheD family endospore coat-associated protein n=1 Tax=Parageobacillus thermoglucosidasius TaxID=1426 RepID=UPI000F616834|nr:YheC/YheD family protein [Parageobacillus thermoglucosidasius]GCD83894.1 endospore coat-associated protein YheC [Parageobacillus thermoglucosidasius]